MVWGRVRALQRFWSVPCRRIIGLSSSLRLVGPKDLLLSRSYVLPEIYFLPIYLARLKFYDFLNTVAFGSYEWKNSGSRFTLQSSLLPLISLDFLWEPFINTSDRISMINRGWLSQCRREKPGIEIRNISPADANTASVGKFSIQAVHALKLLNSYLSYRNEERENELFVRKEVRYMRQARWLMIFIVLLEV